MRPKSIAGQLQVLLILMFVAITAFVVLRIREFETLSQEGTRLTDNLQKTVSLNQDLRQGIYRQIDHLLEQFASLDPAYHEKFHALNFQIGKRQTDYLTLDIGNRERMAVESIKALNTDLGIHSAYIHEMLQAGNRSAALARVRQVDRVRVSIEREFESLHRMQLEKLSGLLERVNRSAASGYRAVYIIAGTLILLLAALGLLLRNRILRPLQSIQDALDQIGRGNFSARAPEMRKNEIGRLARGFNFMAASLAESYGELERKVEERTEQLQQVQRQLLQSEKMSAVGQLVSGVAHELNNPLTGVLGFSQLATLELQSRNSDRKLLKYVQDIHQQADRCRRIVANLLQFARKQEPHLEAIRINDIVERTLQLREYELLSRNVRLVRDYAPENPVICADQQKVQQVALNLLNNAHDAIQETGRAGTIWVQTRREAGSVRVEFRDDGTGLLDPDKVFEPFYTTKEVGKGTGLGLSVCYGIIKEHGGDIRAENWDRGALFTFTLPGGGADHSPCADAVSAEPARPADRTIRALVVDDEDVLLRLQKSMLARMQVEATVVGSGREALEYLEGNDVDIIISDIRMPGVDGLQLYDWVKANRPRIQERFVFVSGDPTGLSGFPAMDDAAIPHIQKPFRFEDYSRIVRRVLEREEVNP